MTLLERFRTAEISDKDIISTFQFKAGGYSNNGKRSYTFGNLKSPEGFWGEIYFNADGELFKIVPGDLLANETAQLDFVNSALRDINGEHGYSIGHRILFSRIPLKGKFQWKEDVRIKPCINVSRIGSGLAWGIDDIYNPDNGKNLGPPYPFILEVRIKKSSNPLIETNRLLEALDFYEWLLSLLMPQVLGVPIGRNGQPKWTILQKDNTPEYHLAYEGFNAHESEVETGEQFSASDIPDVPRYSGNEDYYNHLWFKNNEIELAAQMEFYLDLSDNLDAKFKENFKRALYWFNSGHRIYYYQEQFSIIPFTIAIECLLPNPSSEACPTCKKPLSNGPTKLFKEFMEKHLSLPENLNDFKKSIYPKRSSMVHGSYASRADQGFFSIEKFNESEFTVENFTRRAIIDWLIKTKQ